VWLPLKRKTEGQERGAQRKGGKNKGRTGSLAQGRKNKGQKFDGPSEKGGQREQNTERMKLYGKKERGGGSAVR